MALFLCKLNFRGTAEDTAPLDREWCANSSSFLGCGQITGLAAYIYLDLLFLLCDDSCSCTVFTWSIALKKSSFDLDFAK